MEHTKEILNGKKLPNTAQVSLKGVLYAKGRSRERYVELSKKNKSWSIKDWKEVDRNDFFSKIIKEYLNFAVEQARVGVDESEKY